MEWWSNTFKVIEAESGLKLRQSGARALYLPPYTTLPGDTSDQPKRGDAPWAVYKDYTIGVKFLKDYHLS